MQIAIAVIPDERIEDPAVQRARTFITYGSELILETLNGIQYKLVKDAHSSRPKGTTVDPFVELMQVLARAHVAIAKSGVVPNAEGLNQLVQNMPVSTLNLSVRTRNCLRRVNITTVNELVSRTSEDLLTTRNFGPLALDEVKSKLAELNLKLRD